ncbi:triose-phosphate isomerase [Sulfurimonas sp. HSL-1716]|uniref:triose-phosphate isomerase n=1 Tax=Hydrocurvibacter sulfurireducens TaxID=3131937 RepID=UPI0031F9DC93
MIVAANFKTNLTRYQTREYLSRLEAFIHDNNISQEVFIFPTATSIYSHAGKVNIGIQNAYPTKNGAFTGEIGTDQLDEFEIRTVLIGHSERRHVLGETQEFIANKYQFYKEHGYKIIYCIGEPLEVRKSGTSEMMSYLDSQLVGIDMHYENLILAYEPVWAIGTGVTPTNEDIVSLHSALRRTCTASILYGGSVKADNAKEILSLKNVDGILVGSGALDVDDFCSMINDAENIKLNKEINR